MDPNQPPQQTFSPQTQTPTPPAPVSQPIAAQPVVAPPPPIQVPETGTEPSPPSVETPPQTDEDTQPNPTSINRRTPAKPIEEEPPPEPEQLLLTWSAPEFVATKKPAGWYLMLYGFFAILIVIAVIFKQWFSIPLSIVTAVAITVLGNRKPNNQVYSISNYGVHIGDKQQDFDHFKAFFISDDYGQKVFDLVPVKRFEPLLSMPASAEYLDEAEELLARILPQTEPHEDMIDKVFKYLRF